MIAFSWCLIVLLSKSAKRRVSVLVAVETLWACLPSDSCNLKTRAWNDAEDRTDGKETMICGKWHVHLFILIVYGSNTAADYANGLANTLSLKEKRQNLTVILTGTLISILFFAIWLTQSSIFNVLLAANLESWRDTEEDDGYNSNAVAPPQGQVAQSAVANRHTLKEPTHTHLHQSIQFKWPSCLLACSI